MGRFHLKRNDTRPTLSVTLKGPDGSAYDLTGATSVKLHIQLADGTKLVRDMVVDADPTTGKVTYTWVGTDWDAASGGDPATIGGLVGAEHRMEYEVIGPGAVRLTFPNDQHDVLRIAEDIN